MPSRMRLRESSLLRVPGRYQEDLGPSRADRPLFAHPDVPFNPALSRHCAHPSLPLDYEGVGPSEAERARLLAAEEAAAAAEEEDDKEEEEVEEESVMVMVDGEESWGVAGNDQDAETSGSDSDSEGQSAQPAPPTPFAATPGPTTTPVGTTTTPSAPSTRPAHVTQIPKRQPGQQTSPARSDDESGDSTGGRTRGGRPTWGDLSDGIKFAIAYDMARTGPLSRAVQNLDLSHVEIKSLLGLITEERKKQRKWGKLLAQHPHSAEVPSAEELAPLCPINEGITAGEVRRGRAFLKFLGLRGVAARLGFWEGTGADFHEVQIDGGCRHLVDDFSFLAGGEGEDSSARRLLDLKEGELLLRLDPPADTINPLRLRPGAPLVRAKKLGLARVPRSGGLHPMNYTVGGKSGRRYSTLDKSDWPAWEALYDAGIIPGTSLAVFTAHSLVPSEATFLTEEELEALNAAHPTGGMLGSSPVADANIDYDEGLNSQHQPGRWADPHTNAPHNGYVNPFDDDSPLDIFGDNTSSVSGSAPAVPPSAPGDEPASSPTIAEDDDDDDDDEDDEMGSGAIRQSARITSALRAPGPGILARPRPRLGPNVVYGATAASLERTNLSEADPIAAAIPRLSMERVRFTEDDPIADSLSRFRRMQHPVLGQQAPEVAARIDQLTAAAPRRQTQVHFEDELLPPPSPPRPRVPALVVEAPTDDEEEFESEEEDFRLSGRRGGPRPRTDDPDDGDYRPAARRPRPRAPRARASETRKRARAESPLKYPANKASKRPRSGRGPGRPRKYPLPAPSDPNLLMPPPTTTGSRRQSSNTARRRSPATPRAPGRPSAQPAIPQPPTTQSTENPSNVPTTSNNTGPQEQPVIFVRQASTTEGPQNPSNTPTANDHTGPENPPLNHPSAEPTPANPVPRPAKRSYTRRKAANEDGEEGERAPKRSYTRRKPANEDGAEGERAPKRSYTRRKPANEDGEEGEDAANKRAPRKKREPKLDENGEPIKRQKSRPRRGGPNFSCDGTKKMRSTEGEEMTRAEFEERFTRDELTYRPGGNFGGGTFQVNATGVIWSFAPPPDYTPSERTVRRARKLETTKDTDDTNTSNSQPETDGETGTGAGVILQPTPTPASSAGPDTHPTPYPPTGLSNPQTLTSIAVHRPCRPPPPDPEPHNRHRQQQQQQHHRPTARRAPQTRPQAPVLSCRAPYPPTHARPAAPEPPPPLLNHNSRRQPLNCHRCCCCRPNHAGSIPDHAGSPGPGPRPRRRTPRPPRGGARGRAECPVRPVPCGDEGPV
ncbi:predicted protein [Chaetomium globosum CBS 148.51]|uniref:Uncharacterized protein n=1 Tax=Chaetomium globosum (strain ATCC 6205 / CBS 148.51 / DSM 1962 / NBRC 6347 / NRRL 1970) TaxID=306901 RepID=Q2H2V7_CHAGB|nr:uncharacterized protein CHGG_03889 [Chaetomium globosum CBS 148.51]EAQ87270.1 predicted protein [Chaetomium globosum CBS 148.51]